MANLAEITPSVDDVSLLLRTRTVGESSGGLGSDTGPEDVTTFTNTTRPTATEVESLIETARGVIVGRLDTSVSALPTDQYAPVQHAVAIYTALIVEASFFRNATQQWYDLMTGMLNDTIGGVNDGLPSTPAAAGFGTLKVTTDRQKVSDPPPDVLEVFL